MIKDWTKKAKIELIWEKQPGEFEIIPNKNVQLAVCRGQKAEASELVTTRIEKKVVQELQQNKIPSTWGLYMRPEPRDLSQVGSEEGVGERENMEVKIASLHS